MQEGRHKKSFFKTKKQKKKPYVWIPILRVYCKNRTMGVCAVRLHPPIWTAFFPNKMGKQWWWYVTEFHTLVNGLLLFCCCCSFFLVCLKNELLHLYFSFYVEVHLKLGYTSGFDCFSTWQNQACHLYRLRRHKFYKPE